MNASSHASHTSPAKAATQWSLASAATQWSLASAATQWSPQALAALDQGLTDAYRCLRTEAEHLATLQGRRVPTDRDWATAARMLGLLTGPISQAV